MYWDGTGSLPTALSSFYAELEAAALQLMFSPRFVRLARSEKEVRTAVETLAVVVKNIEESLLDTDHDVLEDFDETIGNCNDVSIVRWKTLVRRHLRQASHPTITVPVLRNNLLTSRPSELRKVPSTSMNLVFRTPALSR